MLMSTCPSHKSVLQNSLFPLPVFRFEWCVIVSKQDSLDQSMTRTSPRGLADGTITHLSTAVTSPQLNSFNKLKDKDDSWCFKSCDHMLARDINPEHNALSKTPSHPASRDSRVSETFNVLLALALRQTRRVGKSQSDRLSRSGLLKDADPSWFCYSCWERLREVDRWDEKKEKGRKKNRKAEGFWLA